MMADRHKSKADRHKSPHQNRHRPGYKRPKPSGTSGPSPNRPRKSAIGEFVGWDGEGITLESGEHIYWLLANSEGGYIHDPLGLSREECLDFMLNEGMRIEREKPGAIHVIFAGGYDVNMILRGYSENPLKAGNTLSFEDARRVYTEGRSMNNICELPGGYRITYVPRKQFRVHYTVGWETDKKGNRKPVKEKFQLWDVFGFFQGSFLTTLQNWAATNPRIMQDYERILEGKALRGSFNADQFDMVLEYTRAEVRGLVVLMDELRKATIVAGMLPKRWDGAGAIAAELLRMHAIKEFKGEDIGARNDQLGHAVRCAFFGGRIELFKHGFTEQTIYHVDANSAYPTAMLELPCLAHGHWKHVDGVKLEELEGFGVYRVSWNYEVGFEEGAGELNNRVSNEDVVIPIGPLPYRYEDGRVFFPLVGRGWYWTPEVRAALKQQERWVWWQLDVVEGWIWVPECDHKPFAWMGELYEQRRRWKAEGNAAQLPAKLGINSCYGKLAQKIGYNPETGRKPPYHQLAWAGYITSHCRARMYEVAMQNPWDLVQIQTDGVFSLKPIQVELGKGLGQWEGEDYQGMVAVAAGNYWCDVEQREGVVRERDGGGMVEKIRGFDRVAPEGSGLERINPDAIVKTWKSGEAWRAFSNVRFITLGAACTGEKAFGKWCHWLQLGDGIGRQIHMTTPGIKRQKYDQWHGEPWRELIPTRPSDLSLMWGDDESAECVVPWLGDDVGIDGLRMSELLSNVEQE